MSFGGAPEIEQSEHDKQLAVIAERKWQDYQRRYKPVENRLIQEVQGIGDAEGRARMAGRAASATQQAYAGASPQAPAGSGAALANIVDTELGRAGATTAATTEADTDTRRRRQAGLESIIAMGRDIENQGVAGLSSQASIDQSRLDADARVDRIRDAGISNAIGTAAGLGIQRYAQGGGGGGVGNRSPGQVAGVVDAAPDASAVRRGRGIYSGAA